MVSMTSKHRDPALTVRPPQALQERTKNLLAAHGLETKAFVVACMRALDDEPGTFLAQLAPHWPAPAPRGRPWPETSAPDADAAEQRNRLGQ